MVLHLGEDTVVSMKNVGLPYWMQKLPVYPV